MLKIGIIGAGQSATAHADGITQSGLGQVVRVYAPDNSSAVAPRYGARPAPTAQEIVTDPAVQVVVIASPTDTHMPYIREAIAHGKHVLCEVPVARTTGELEEISALIAANKDLVLAASLPGRFDAAMIQLKNSVEAGDLGQIGTVRMGRLGKFRGGQHNWYADFDRSGGVTLDSLAHVFDNVETCFGKIQQLYALRSPESCKLNQDYVLLIAKLVDGTLIHLEASWSEHREPTHSYYEISGTNGIIEHDSRVEPKLVIQAKSDHRPALRSALECSHPWNPAPATHYQSLAAEFLQAILEKRPTIVPLSAGVRATSLALKALQANELSAAVNVN